MLFEVVDPFLQPDHLDRRSTEPVENSRNIRCCAGAPPSMIVAITPRAR
jgi:hypothetical protein